MRSGSYRPGVAAAVRSTHRRAGDWNFFLSISASSCQIVRLWSISFLFFAGIGKYLCWEASWPVARNFYLFLSVHHFPSELRSVHVFAQVYLSVHRGLDFFLPLIFISHGDDRQFRWRCSFFLHCIPAK